MRSIAWMPLLLSSALSAKAGAFVIYFGTVFSGSAPGSTEGAWLTALFADVAPGQVRLTLSAPYLTGEENVRQVYLNLNPQLNPRSLLFVPLARSGALDWPTVSTGANAFKADGDGLYDILLNFAPGGTSENRFTAGETLVYDISGIPTLNALDFNFLSALAPGGAGPFFAAAHIQRIGPDSNSGFIASASGFQPIPEPAIWGLWGLGAGAWLWARKKLRKRS